MKTAMLQKADDGGPLSGVSDRKTDDGGRKSVDRCQVSGQWLEDRGRWSEVHGQ